MSFKAVLAYSIVLVLNFYIDLLLLLAYCLAFILDQLKDPPASNNADKTSVVQDGTISENGPTVVGDNVFQVGITPTVPTDKTSASPIPLAEVQSPLPSLPPPALPSIQLPRDSMATIPSASHSSTPNLPLIPAPLAA
ncbi:hypothetical protein FRB99_008360, partial [Tulasnella sp. 403]